MLMLQSSIDEGSLINFDDHRKINILAAAAVFARCSLSQNRCQQIRSRSMNSEDTSEWQNTTQKRYVDKFKPQEESHDDSFLGKPTVILENYFLAFV